MKKSPFGYRCGAVRPIGERLFHRVRPAGLPTQRDEGRGFSLREQRQAMTRSIAVAAVQLRARDRGDSAAALESALDAVRRCSRADVVVLPEATFPAYVMG